MQLVLRADNLTTFMCRLSRNLEASTSWKLQGLSRPVMELLYLDLYLINRATDAQSIRRLKTDRVGLLVYDAVSTGHYLPTF